MMVEVEEEKRIENLLKYEILDTPADGSFDEITALAANIFNVPIAIISLVDTDRIWFKSAHGIDAEQIGRDPGLCSSAIMSEDTYVVEAAKTDPRTLSNPLVVGVLGLEFYAAAPLKTEEGYNIGTICIIDKRPRQFSPEQFGLLRQLARVIVNQLEVRLQARMLMKELGSK